MAYKKGNHYSQEKDGNFVDNMGTVHTTEGLSEVGKGTDSTNFHAIPLIKKS